MPRWSALLLAVVFAAALPAVRAQAEGGGTIIPFMPPVAGPISGLTDSCDDFKLALLPFGLADFDIADEGWVWVDPSRKFRSVSGRVKGSHVAYNDTPANHNSHDHNTNIVVDPGLEDILSIANDDDEIDPRPVDTIEVEWEIGAKPSEKKGDGANPTFPKWAWPSVGDRVWVEGHWIFDCGHPTEEIIGYTEIGGIKVPLIRKHYRSEIHPARAIASMRDQARALPGSGNMAVPVTATDLYIHGRGGFVVEQLNCGMGIIIDGVPPNGDHDGCPTKTTPIAKDYNFDVCLPPANPGGTLTWTYEPGPGNTIAVDPVITEVTPAASACQGGAFDTQKMLHVVVPLAGSGAVPEDVYARKIYAGWVGGTQPELRHFKVTLKKMDLHDDQDLDPGDGELTFFWMNVNRADNEWIRLSDFANGNMNDYDDDDFFGDGLMSFTGAVFDFFVRPGQTFTIAANGYDQDCYDGSFGDHDLKISTYVGCAVDIPEAGNNDPMVRLPSDVDPDATTFGEPNYGVGNQDLKARHIIHLPNNQQVAVSQYELEIKIEEILDNTPPVTTAAATPPANGNGWNNTNVTVSFSAVDNPGGTGVAEMVLHGEGTEPFDLVVPSGSATRTFTAEGITTITYFSRDVQGNEEVPHTLAVRIDKTPPTIAGSRTPPANQYGWNNTDVTVNFSCGDNLSGIASCGPAQVITTEGANQSRTGVAVDLAGNTANAVVNGINIDKTPPVITGLPANCVLWPADHRMVPVGTATVTDALSGLLPGSVVISAASNEPVDGAGDGSTHPDIVITASMNGGQIQLRAERAGSGTGRIYSIGATASDLAGNVATGAAVCTVPHSK